MARQVTPGLRTPLHTTLPASPLDGQEINYLANATDGVIWRLRYRTASGSAYKWELAGGGSLNAGASGDITTSSAAVVAMTAGPSIVVPLAGDYDLDLWLGMLAGVAASGYAAAVVMAGAVNTGIGPLYVFANNVGQRIDLGATGKVAAIPAGTTLSVGVNCANSASNRFINARLRALPVRVG